MGFFGRLFGKRPPEGPEYQQGREEQKYRDAGRIDREYCLIHISLR